MIVIEHRIWIPEMGYSEWDRIKKPMPEIQGYIFLTAAKAKKVRKGVFYREVFVDPYNTEYRMKKITH